MKHEITTGSYWFYRRRFDRGCMNMEIVLDSTVDGAALQAAALRTIGRYPCLKFTYEISEDGTQYLLTENSRTFSVFENSGFVSIEDPASGGYLWSLGYSGERLYLSVFHGLTDGMGLASIMKAVICFYYSILDRSPLPDNIAAIGVEPNGLEYADPFDYARPCDRTYPFNAPEPFLPWSEEAGTSVTHHRLIVMSLREVLSVSKQTEGNVSGIISLILARAIGRMIDDPSLCVIVKCPINLRPMLGCTETLQNCVSSMKYVYSEKSRKMPFQQQASCFKGMLLIQSSEEFLLNSFLAWKSEVLAFNRGSSIEEKREALSALETGLPMVSYLGSLSAGPYDKHLRSFSVTVDTGGAIGVVAASLSDRLYLNLLMPEKRKALVRAFTDELDSLEISYAVE